MAETDAAQKKKHHRVGLKWGTRVISEEIREEMSRLRWKEGMTCTAIGLKFGLGNSTVSRITNAWLRDEGKRNKGA